jgi:hypothetical protein
MGFRYDLLQLQDAIERVAASWAPVPLVISTRAVPSPEHGSMAEYGPEQISNVLTSRASSTDSGV